MKRYTLLWQKLRKLRRGKLDLFQSEVAERVGVSKTTYIAWETGRVQPKAEHLIKIANLFGNEVYKEEEVR
jgi:DNA-binding XRE family transcriptional regulator